MLWSTISQDSALLNHALDLVIVIRQQTVAEDDDGQLTADQEFRIRGGIDSHSKLARPRRPCMQLQESYTSGKN